MDCVPTSTGRICRFDTQCPFDSIYRRFSCWGCDDYRRKSLWHFYHSHVPDRDYYTATFPRRHWLPFTVDSQPHLSELGRYHNRRLVEKPFTQPCTRSNSLS